MDCSRGQEEKREQDHATLPGYSISSPVPENGHSPDSPREPFSTGCVVSCLRNISSSSALYRAVSSTYLWDIKQGTRVHGETRASLCKLSIFGHHSLARHWDPAELFQWLCHQGSPFSLSTPASRENWSVRLRCTLGCTPTVSYSTPEHTLRHMSNSRITSHHDVYY